MDRGENAEGERRQRRNGQREHQHASVQGQIQHDADVSLRYEQRHHTAAPTGEGQRPDSAHDRQQQALDQQLPHQPQTPGSNRQPHGDLPLARGRARQEQTGDVAARDQQN